MSLNPAAAEHHSWFEPSDLGSAVLLPRAPSEATFVRLWHGFMTARVMMAIAIGLLQVLIYALGQHVHPLVPPICAGYVAATLAVRMLAEPRRPDQSFGRQWIFTVGVDAAVYSALQFIQQGAMNYTPLFALPLLLVSVLGSLRLALGTAAGITLLLLAGAWWPALNGAADTAPRMLEAALTGAGYFVVALLVNQLASRLAREELRSRRSQIAAQLQTQVNELVIETLADGVAVIDASGNAHAVNPAARLLLGGAESASRIPFALAEEPAWWPLLDLVNATFHSHGPQNADVMIHHAGQGERRLRVRTRLTSSRSMSGESLCVLFLHDLREMEARLRTEKLAAMGRMSTAVAHEIRNPLAAIIQANALLDEELVDPAQKRLAKMVRQNARRLAKISEEVLDISRVQQQLDAPSATVFALDPAVATICSEWGAHQSGSASVQVALAAPGVDVEFEPDHLRRVLVNLLDNARRYAGQHPDSLQISTCLAEGGQARLSVWSDGAPMEQAVQEHLFEPFFSSESRSTGLGLYICRELCERHGASISYSRESGQTACGAIPGNAFLLAFRPRVRAAAVGERQLDAVLV